VDWFTDIKVCFYFAASKQEEMPSYGVFPEYRDHPDGPPITKEISRIGHGPLRPESNEVSHSLLAS